MNEDVNSNSAFHVRFSKGYELMDKHPEYIPVMFSVSSSIELEKDTIMCKKEATLSNLVTQFRKLLKQDDNSPSSGFIFFIKHNDKDILPKLSEKMGDLHDKYHGSDMWLKMVIRKEEIFG